MEIILDCGGTSQVILCLLLEPICRNTLLLLSCFFPRAFIWISLLPLLIHFQVVSCSRTWNTIVSAGDVFELGFFSTGSSYYVGIWFKQVPKEKQSPVWVANRDDPCKSSSVLKIEADGNLGISDDKLFYKVTNVSSKGNTSVRLLDSGNLILLDSNSQRLWQSFHHPTDTLIQGMKLGYNKQTGETWSLLSWKNDADPGSGSYSLQPDPNQTSQFFIMQGSTIYWTSGTWKGKFFSQIPEMRSNYLFNFSYVDNDYERYLIDFMYDNSTISKAFMDMSGHVRGMIWLNMSQEWESLWIQPRQDCDVYARCGSFGRTSFPNVDARKVLNLVLHKIGTISIHLVDVKTPLQCENTTANQKEDMFEELSSVLYPVVSQDLVIWSAENCKQACLNSCSCSAYAYNGSGGCSIWSGSFFNLQQLSNANTYGNTIYVRLAASEFSVSRARKLFWVIVLVPALSLVLLLVVCSISKQCMKKLNQNGGVQTSREVQDLLLLDLGISILGTDKKFATGDPVEEDRNKDPALLFFSFASIAAATDNFSLENKLGQGGFGHVYKGKTLNGHEIAVKRLSRRSGQGLEELKNEAMVIAKLQHRNLVRLLGCCLEFDEKILIYEYMPNKSLDLFLFDPSKRSLLDWQVRVHIIDGIAQGLLYLHQYSPQRFEGHGYVSPEYALEGVFSVKSDVFSFGVLLLEILSGKRNAETIYNMHEVQKLLNAGRPVVSSDVNGANVLKLGLTGHELYRSGLAIYAEAGMGLMTCSMASLPIVIISSSNVEN
ncbi:LOW QUALITY PROTEIN: S-locus glycoprotein domain [Dillenia turbinata]|uniref:Receptor-like serine/threonine-protein kinase n=1 Tax=Dillenia turbinata TaxID=194707 RepID=A0AAN8W7S1_9MAGN